MAVRFVPPRLPLVDQRTGCVTREWYLFFQGLMDPNASDSEALLEDALLSAYADVGSQLPSVAGLGDELASAPLAGETPEESHTAAWLMPEPDTDLLMVPPSQGTDGTVTDVTGTAPIASTGGTTPAISISPATGTAAGSMSAADKAALDAQYTAPTSTTPTATALSGTITSSSTTVRWKQTGKLVWFSAACTITNNGTGAVALSIPMPATSAAFEHSFGGRENLAVGFGVSGVILASTAALIVQKYDATYPGGNNYRVTVTGIYEAA